MKLILLLSILVFAAISTDWGSEKSSLSLLSFLPEKIKQSFFRLTPDEVKLIRQYRQEIVKIYENDTFWLFERTLQFYISKNATAAAEKLRKGYWEFINEIGVYDNVTKDKLYEFAQEVAEAHYRGTEYHTAYALMHYLHLRNGWGVKRQAIRKLFPVCERFSQLPEIREFYMARKSESPRNLAVLKDFD